MNVVTPLPSHISWRGYCDLIETTQDKRWLTIPIKSNKVTTSGIPISVDG